MRWDLVIGFYVYAYCAFRKELYLLELGDPSGRPLAKSGRSVITHQRFLPSGAPNHCSILLPSILLHF